MSGKALIADSKTEYQTRAGLSRRDCLRMSLITAATAITGFNSSWWQTVVLAETKDQFAGGNKIGVVGFIGEGSREMNSATGTELDGRLYTNLSTLTPEHPIPRTKDFYIRTRASNLLEYETSWTIQLSGLAGERASFSLARLTARERPMGVHFMECVGNTSACSFGLLSAASWTGVPLSEVLGMIREQPRATQLLVSGFDHYQSGSVTSIPGASWIFKLADLEARGAFLATRMNGELLSRDHGAPVRLIVPGWYGCACIKWVNEIALVSEDAAATSQMKEYAERTGQQGVPDLARDYLPAAVEYAAVPIRVEQWSVDGASKYRVVGILWGGSAPVKKLEIRFNPEDEFIPVDHLEHSGKGSWRFWSHAWVPQNEGTYLIRLQVKDPVVETKRLDSGRYLRAVTIGERG
jgi:DMSO/TMAO reductase YedYZ molybdopterin-dependent catalytic subunit